MTPVVWFAQACETALDCSNEVTEGLQTSLLSTVSGVFLDLLPLVALGVAVCFAIACVRRVVRNMRFDAADRWDAENGVHYDEDRNIYVNRWGEEV